MLDKKEWSCPGIAPIWSEGGNVFLGWADEDCGYHELRPRINRKRGKTTFVMLCPRRLTRYTLEQVERIMKESER